MTTLREATMNDLLKFNNVNLDVLTETYNMSFYYHYLSKWPESFTVAEGPNNNSIMGYVLGKAEGDDKLWHGHVSAVTVAPSYRRLGLAKTLMDDFENLCVNTYQAHFVDLFVRSSNHLAQEMYEKFGYSKCKYRARIICVCVCVYRSRIPCQLLRHRWCLYNSP
jgi:N-terminal acetyltransferase B complex catalytic subunit